MRKDGGRDEAEERAGSEQLAVLVLITLSQSVGFSFTSTLVLRLLHYLPGTGLVSLSTGDVTGPRHPGTIVTV